MAEEKQWAVNSVIESDKDWNCTQFLCTGLVPLVFVCVRGGLFKRREALKDDFGRRLRRSNDFGQTKPNRFV
jgi:hypothetical protein